MNYQTLSMYVMLVMTWMLVVTVLMSLVFSKKLVETDTNLRTAAVTTREVSVEEPGHRSIRSTGMPAKKRFIFRLNGEEVELDLELNNLIRDDVSVHVTENGVTKLMEIPKDDKEMYGYYQDTKTKSALMVKCDKLGSTCQPIGTFMLNGRRYRLESTGDLLGATHFVTEIGLDDGDAGMPGDSQQIPELQGLTSENQNENSGTDDKRGRMKRAISAGVDIIELFIYTDESIYQRFLDLYGNNNTAMAMIRQYYALISNEIDLEFQQVKPANNLGIDIQIYLKGVHVALVSSDAPWSYQAEDSNGNLNSSTALILFSAWHKNYSTANNLEYDHAMAITKKKFQGTSGGRTWFSAVCFKDSYYHASIIEDRGCRLVLTSVHVIGHFLAANHDDTTGSCSHGYIMSPSFYTANATTARIQHTFSSCSIDSMTSFLYKLKPKRCTRQHSFTDAEYTAYRSQPIGGEVLSLDQQCQVYFGSTSFACDKRQGADICYMGILCQTSTDCNGTLSQVLDHSPCPELAYGWCFQGLCIPGPTPPTTKLDPTTTTALSTTTTAPTTTDASTTTTAAPTTTTVTPTTTATPTTTDASTTTTTAPTTTTVTPTTTATPTTTDASTTTTVASATTTATPTTTTPAPTTTTASTTTTAAPTTTTAIPTTSTATPTTTAEPTTTTVAHTTTETATTTTPAPTITAASTTTTAASTTTTAIPTTSTVTTTTTAASTTTTVAPTTTTAIPTSTATPTTTAAPTTTTVAHTTTTEPATTTTPAPTTTSASTTTTVAPTTTTAIPTTSTATPTTTAAPTTTTVAHTTTKETTTTTTAAEEYP